MMSASQLLAAIAATDALLRGQKGIFIVTSLTKKPPLTAAKLSALEKGFGHALPPILRELYTTVGATLSFRWRFAPGKGAAFGCTGMLLPWGALALVPPELEGDTGMVRFLADENGRYYALAWGKKKAPEVVYYDHEEVDGGRDVAASAEAFFKALAGRGFMHIEDDTDALEAFFAGKKAKK